MLLSVQDSANAPVRHGGFKQICPGGSRERLPLIPQEVKDPRSKTCGAKLVSASGPPTVGCGHT